ncbi:transcription elongation factor A protein 3 isoform X2 [Gouania willdenowi]|uniref:Transcription elongation factor A protein 3-like n=1 Tax=Gouania willdenowi TaxID=441366 RepID=A0A8C5EXN6_GOUWI|nr:pollen-specific leucine-rich repeat extensin-like protein 2 isoform X2 [Gouania willdenowi]
MTREEDLMRIAKKLDKMVSRNNTEGAMDLLKELRSFNMTLKLLQETRIGMSVNGIRKHCTDEEVVSLAKVLIKDWKRLLAQADSGHSHSEKVDERRNSLDSTKTSPCSSPSETQSTDSHRMDVQLKHNSEPDKKDNKERKEKQNHEVKSNKPPTEDSCGVKHSRDSINERNPPEIQMVEQTARLQMEDKKQKHQSDKHRSELRKERPSGETKIMRHSKEHQEELNKHCGDDKKKDKREESRPQRPIHGLQRAKPHSEPHGEKLADVYRQMFERRSVLDSSILYPTRFPSPPRPARPPLPIKHPASDLKKDRKDGKESSSRHPRPHASPPTSPKAKGPSVELKKERKPAADPNAPIAPLPFHLHPHPPPPPRKEPPDPNAPLPPLPLHLHPPPPPSKSHTLEGKKDQERKSPKDSKQPTEKKTVDHVKKDRKNSVDNKVTQKHLDEAKRERKDSSESKPTPKKSSLEVRKENHRRESSDCMPGQAVKRHSTESKAERRESTNENKSSPPPAKKLTGERRESHGSKPSLPSPPLRKLSTDSLEKKSKVEPSKTPTTPTSPMSPSFSSPGGPLSPHFATGDSIRDKCIEMLTAALRTDNDYKDFGANCDSMAAEIEDHIYQEIKATDMKYKNRVRSRISNLKDPKNPGLRRNVLAGSIDLSRIASMSAEEMASDELKQLRNVLTQEAIREHQMAKTGGTSTDLLQCGKCKKRNCTYNQVQTRSADEPMTTFVLCNECGNRWKFC